MGIDCGGHNRVVGPPGAWLGCALHVVADFLGDEHLIRGERVRAKVAGLFVGVAL